MINEWRKIFNKKLHILQIQFMIRKFCAQEIVISNRVGKTCINFSEFFILKME